MPPSNRTLFVGGLPDSTSSEQLADLFRQHGELADAEVFKDHAGASRCFGFVSFGDAGEARKAKAALDGTSVPGALQGRSIKVRWALDTRTLFVGDLGPQVTQPQLQEAFQQFGDVLSCRLVREARELGGTSRRHGFVEYERRTVAAKVQQLLSENLFLLGNTPRPVRVEFALDLAEEERAEGAPLHPDMVHAPPPHFAQPGTLEFDFALKWRELTLAQQAEAARLKDLHRGERDNLREEQADVFERERGKLKRLEELAHGYVEPSAPGAKRPRES